MLSCINSWGPNSGSERLRILHIAPSLSVGGAEQMATHLMIGLAASHTVGAVGLLPYSDNAVERRLQNAGIPKWHLNKRPGFDMRMFGALSRVFREFQPDVVHTHMAVQRYVFPVLLRSRVPAAIHTIHNLARHETDSVGRVVHWFAFRNRVVPVAISREVAASVQRVYGLACNAVVPNCIPVERYQPNDRDRQEWRARFHLGPEAVVFTCVGRLVAQKNPLLLMEAFAQVKDPRAHLVLLGEGPLAGEVAQYAKARALTDRVHLLGKQDCVPQMLAASDVFVLSSDWEGNPLAVMEAMAAGLPVVATAVGGVPELVASGEQGFLVPAGDAPAFASAMQTLLGDSELRRAMAAAAGARACREFTLERMVRGYEELYRQTVMAFRQSQDPSVEAPRSRERAELLPQSERPD